ncbi:MAG: thiamine biosynthesis protein [Burkholderiales bacterium]|nr:thiamine biosynthesis protein [Burkholderiales bacterium]
MKITQDVRDYAAQQGLAEEEALKKGLEEKSREFIRQGGEIYNKA